MVSSGGTVCQARGVRRSVEHAPVPFIQHIPRRLNWRPCRWGTRCARWRVNTDPTPSFAYDASSSFDIEYLMRKRMGIGRHTMSEGNSLRHRNEKFQRTNKWKLQNALSEWPNRTHTVSAFLGPVYVWGYRGLYSVRGYRNRCRNPEVSRTPVCPSGTDCLR